jgi:hypothetical protein
LPKKNLKSHINILFKIQQTIELEEASSVITKLKEGTILGNQSPEIVDNIFHDLMTFLNVWRERLPHKNEDLCLWRDLMDQRNYLNNVVNTKLKRIFSSIIRPDDIETEAKLGYFDDTLWNNLKYAQIERNYSFFKTISNICRDDAKNDGRLNMATVGAGNEFYLKQKETVIYL